MQITDEMLYQYAPEARDIWLSSRPQKNDVPKYLVSRKFARKMDKLIREQRRSPRTNQILLYMKRTVAIAMVALTVSFAGLMTVEAYRDKFVEIITHVFHELTEYRFYTKETEIVLPDISFGYIPDGMIEKNQNSYDAERKNYRYESESGAYFELSQIGISSASSYVQILDTEDAYVEEFMLHGNLATAIDKDGVGIIQWTDKNIVYKLYGELNFDELKEIAKNLKIFKN